VSAVLSAKEHKPSLQVRLISGIISRLLRLGHTTWQREIIGREHIQQALERQERVLVVFWHGKYVPLFVLLRGFEACILTTRSFRGDIIAAICKNFGYDSAEIPDHATMETPSILDRISAEHHFLGIAADGPHGPYHSVKAGLVHFASQLQLVIIPASVSVRRKIVFKKRWDRMEIPLFFSRVCLVLGEPLRVPPVLRHQELKEWTQRLKKIIEDNELRAKSSFTDQKSL
jgi:lysophospholipid acyltransferase (LPLAT)-like uncharacterized protein